MKLNAKQLDAARSALLGEHSDQVIRYMAGQSVAIDSILPTQQAQEIAQNCGWTLPKSEARTSLGFLVSDSCREYLFWQERHKALPFENGLPHLSDTLFEGKYVAEIGSGMGANLMSLSHRTGRVCGVEPVETYIQLGEIFCTREGISTLETRVGGAESLPFQDDELDLVLCVSAHQYFDIMPAFHEISRVLKRGGELVIIGGILSDYARHSVDYALNSEGPKAVAITLVNSLSYTAVGRRIIGNRNGFSTSRPVYPTSNAMIRWMHDAGLTQKTPFEKIGEETCFHAVLSG
ncbi:methyltransferase family protein [Litoreibacter halocynthiae]|uniref:Methyltransferase family protein n=1 Tax=Litoreibacter halocynthiae TaxID=1242689 RepID=A0A4R7LEX5_9RHOB|nr:class I SAM-dependent methyltransferase [Litoreibacter halocynthiae]TDT73122.1 methyltransferase family protein [Litoreibacter halocynthiae]